MGGVIDGVIDGVAREVSEVGVIANYL